MPKAAPTPTVAMSTPAAGASRICAVTATVHNALLASTRSSASMMSGTSEEAAGLNNSVPTETPNATP